jgi:UDP-N-acetyl-D-mannosaminuronic acid dehydrogenase
VQRLVTKSAAASGSDTEAIMNFQKQSLRDFVPFTYARKSWFQNVCIIGLGYIGLPTATLAASRGFDVRGVDINRNTVATINAGKCHFHELGLEALVNNAVEEGHLSASTEVAPADIFMICVPTPAVPDGEGNKVCDLSFVLKAAESIAPHLKSGDLVIVESTSPIGTCDRVSEVLAKRRNDLTFPHQNGDKSDVAVAYCPERVIPGRMITELVENDRVIGGMTPRCAEKAAALYRSFVNGKIHITSARVAEAVKLTENSFRDVNIAFANELSMLFAGLGVDTKEVIELANCHPRVNILTPGPGVGGHCIPVDPWFLWESMPERAPLIRTARQVNDAKAHYVLDQILAEHAKTGGTVACLGLSYKADVDDFRESPAYEIAEALHEKLGNKMIAIDPFASALLAGKKQPGFAVTNNLEAAANADMIVALVAHKAFKVLNVRGNQKVLDTCGLFANAA